jgi:hypothetical protein
VNDRDDDRAEPDAPSARAALRWHEGRPVLSVSERVERADDRIDALIRDVRTLGLSVAASERTARDRGHAHADALLVLTADVAHLRDAIGPEPDARASIADMSPEDVRALASQGLRPAVHAMLVQHAAERAEDIARAKATAAKLARVERGQSRSTSLLAVLLLTVTALQESGALRGLLRALFGG